VALVLGVMLAGCTSLEGLRGGDANDASAPRPDAGDGSAAGSSDVADAGGSIAEASLDAEGGGRDNLVANPSFEQGQAGCGPGWTPGAAVMTRSSTARTGAASCQICANPTDTQYMNLSVSAAIAVKAGSYTAEAWLRAPPTGAAAGRTGVQIFFHPAGGGSDVLHQALILQPGGDWEPSNESFVLPQDGTLDFVVHGYEPNGGCVLVDDVSLYRE
jgi:hypothetical protein